MCSRILRKSYPAELAAIRQIRLEVAEIAISLGSVQEVVDRVRLAVSEAASNVVQHAYEEGRGEIHITVTVPKTRLLTVIVADDGDWLAQRRRASGLGLGLFLMRDCADGFHFERTQSGGLGVHMSFLLDGSRPRGGENASPVSTARSRSPLLSVVTMRA